MIYLKGCLFTILFQEHSREKFAFTGPPYNNSQCDKGYQWKILPQGILNSPMLGPSCNIYLNSASINKNSGIRNCEKN